LIIKLAMAGWDGAIRRTSRQLTGVTDPSYIACLLQPIQLCVALQQTALRVEFHFRLATGLQLFTSIRALAEAVLSVRAAA
jgi:hypothetical protein